MPLIASNGTGGGNFASTASWAGGVVPSGTTGFQVVGGDTITVPLNTTALTGPNSLQTLIGDNNSPATNIATLNVIGSLIFGIDGNTGSGINLRSNGVIKVQSTGVLNPGTDLNFYGGDLSIAAPGGVVKHTTDSGSAFFVPDVVRTFSLSNPHYFPFSPNPSFPFSNMGPGAGTGGTYGPLGNVCNQTFNTVPSLIVGQTGPGGIAVASVKQQTVYANFVAAFQDFVSNNYYAVVSFGTTYNANNSTGSYGCTYPMAIPLMNGLPLLDVNNDLGNGANAPVPVQIWSSGQQDGAWEAIVELPSSLGATPAGLGIRTFADNSGGNWTVQDFVYQAGSGAVTNTPAIGSVASQYLRCMGDVA